MASIPNSGKEKLEMIHFSLNSALKNEIELMRELLANLHQEELALLENDKHRWAQVMEERSDHIVNLKEIRHQRICATEDLSRHTTFVEKGEILPVQDERSCEIFSKLDQLLALLERINLQNCRNDVLFDQSKQKQDLPLQCTYPHPLHREKRKTKVATYTRKN